MKLFSYFTSTWILLLAWTFNAPGADAPKTFKVGEQTFTRPANWEWVEPASSMRKAQLKIAEAGKKESAEVVFFYFGEGNGGGTKANVERWLGQFQEPQNTKTEEISVGPKKVTCVQAEGTYLSGMPGGSRTPQPNSMLLGAILESPTGNVFIKITGPLSVVKPSKDTLRKLVEDALK